MLLGVESMWARPVPSPAWETGSQCGGLDERESVTAGEESSVENTSVSCSYSIQRAPIRPAIVIPHPTWFFDLRSVPRDRALSIGLR